MIFRMTARCISDFIMFAISRRCFDPNGRGATPGLTPLMVVSPAIQAVT